MCSLVTFIFLYACESWTPAQNTTHLIQRPCHQQGSPCQDPTGNWTMQRPEHRKETQTVVVWTCLPFIRSGQNHLARHSEKGKKTWQTEQEVAKIQQAISPHKDLLIMVKRRKLQWYDYVSRSSGLAKTILQGTVKGGRRQGSQRKRWEDNIREWTA